MVREGVMRFHKIGKSCGKVVKDEQSGMDSTNLPRLLSTFPFTETSIASTTAPTATAIKSLPRSLVPCRVSGDLAQQPFRRMWLEVFLERARHARSEPAGLTLRLERRLPSCPVKLYSTWIGPHPTFLTQPTLSSRTEIIQA